MLTGRQAGIAVFADEVQWGVLGQRLQPLRGLIVDGPGRLEGFTGAGLVRSEKAGRVRTVHIEAAPLREAEHWLARQRAIWEGRLDRLSALAEQIAKEEGQQT